ncbi:MAG: ABC transporter ATP-binding protein [Halobacteria archaeon]
MDAIRATGLLKRYGGGTALDGLDLEVPEGRVFGLLGPNGAGKTTFLAVCSGLLKPDGGRVEVLGLDPVREGRKVRSLLNLCSGHANFLWNLRVEEILRYYAMLYSVPRAEREARISLLVEQLELGPWRRARFDTLSTGAKQRLAVAKALVNRPRLLLLDEPTLGLDPDISRKVRAYLKRLRAAGGTTMVVTSHNMAEIEELCDEVAFIRKGRVVARGSPEELKRQFKFRYCVTLGVEGGPAFLDLPVEHVREGARPPTHPVSVSEHEGRGPRVLKFEVERLERLGEVVTRLAQKGASIREIRVEEPDLEEVFMELAKGG